MTFPVVNPGKRLRVLLLFIYQITAHPGKEEEMM